MLQRSSPYAQRSVVQRDRFTLPLLPTTTIGSFPQTAEVRRSRKDVKAGRISEQQYEAFLKQQIARTIRFQEDVGLDVLVHGEAERNDMVEYFGEQLNGFAIYAFGWVQSYGSRCVKPPIIYGDVSRPRPMTVDWILRRSLDSEADERNADRSRHHPQWSFVRDDQPRSHNLPTDCPGDSR